MLTADGDATEFYKKIGFSRAMQTEPMWIYSGGDQLGYLCNLRFPDLQINTG